MRSSLVGLVKVKAIPNCWFLPGGPNEDELLSTFQKAQESSVRNLDDNNFEHLTQAATGATTGDWLVML